MQRCVNVGLVQGERLSVDGTVIFANASSKLAIADRTSIQALALAGISRLLAERGLSPL